MYTHVSMVVATYSYTQQHKPPSTVVSKELHLMYFSLGTVTLPDTIPLNMIISPLIPPFDIRSRIVISHLRKLIVNDLLPPRRGPRKA